MREVGQTCPAAQLLTPQQRQVLRLHLFLGTWGPRVSRRCSLFLSELAAGIWELSTEQCWVLCADETEHLEPVVFFLSQLPAATRLGSVITQCSPGGCNTVFRSLISSRLSQPDGEQWTPPKAMRKVTLHTHPSVRVSRWAVGATSELRSPWGTCSCRPSPWVLLSAIPTRPCTSQGVWRHYRVCMLPVSTLQLGGVLYACVLGRLCVAVASVHG